MKRLLLSLVGITAVIILALVVWNLFRPISEGNEPGVEAAAATESEVVMVVDDGGGETAVTTNTLDQPLVTEETEETYPTEADVKQPFEIEALENAVQESAAFDAPHLGRGGGGGFGYGCGGEDAPFANATLTLNADLPQETESSVYERSFQYDDVTIDEAAIREFADKVGVTGDLYFGWYDGMPIDGQDDGSGNIPYAYRILDGKRQVAAYMGGEIYYEDTSLYNSEFSPLPFAERAALAEQFLLERNLLDFEYEIHPSWGKDVQFLPVLDGRPVKNWAQITVNVTGDGQVMTVALRPLANLNELKVESLRSAADAWQYLQENIADSPMMFNLIDSNPVYYAPPQNPDFKTHWEREFAAGQEVTLTSWIQTYRAADGSGKLRLSTDRGTILAADDVTLEAITEAVSSGNIVRLQGAISGEADNLVLNVSNWEQIMGAFDVYLNGTTRQVNGGIALELPGGFPIQIANPPADLPLDTFISMSSWGVRVADDGVSAIADWVNIDLMDYPNVEPEILNVDPYINISNVTINEVELVYQFLYPYESLNPLSEIPYINNDNGHLVPVWRFSGETNKGDLVEFMIPAPATVELPTFPTE